MKDVVIGAITNYSFDKIEPWVNSLEKSGFTGDKIMVCYNIDYDTVSELVKRNFIILGFNRDEEKQSLVYHKENFNICLERFGHMYYFLKEAQEKYRYLIATDVRDVIFQRNPSEWLEENLGDKKINASSESIRYKDENWGRDNLKLSFSEFLYEVNKDNIIHNAGVLSGDYETMLDLFLNISLSCGASPVHVPGGGGPDQAALNILLNLKPYRDITRFTSSEDGWAAQLGTTVDPYKLPAYGPVLTDPSPRLENGKVVTSTGKEFTIVHQYDRIPQWKDIIEKQYR